MTATSIPRLIEESLSPGFFISPRSSFQIIHAPRVVLAWEIFRGHLLDASQTRQQRSFEAWQLEHSMNPGIPTLMVLWDHESQALSVVRGLQVRGHEAYQEANQILTRDTTKTQLELVGTIPDAGSLDACIVGNHLRQLLFRAVIGTSRLPVTSLESPLPAFSLGSFGYFPQCVTADGSLKALERRIADRDIDPLTRAKALEFWLRLHAPEDAVHDTPPFLQAILDAGVTPASLRDLLCILFNHVALSPLGRFDRNLATLLRQLAIISPRGREAACDTVAYWLRHLCRHLAAYDLATFHSQGANYPDALILDVLLRLLVEWIHESPELFLGTRANARTRRRALRQAWIARKLMEGLPVPSVPTSMGENRRILPGQPSVSEEELLYPNRRTSRLFANEPVERYLSSRVRSALEQALADLDEARELRELGTATYLDRPLGTFKAPTEVDRSPLLSYEAYSRTLAKNRLDHCLRWELMSKDRHAGLARVWERTSRVRGVAAMELPGRQRPGVVTLEDARQAHPDFVFLRSTLASRTEFLGSYDFQALAADMPDDWKWLLNGSALLIRTPATGPLATPDWLMTAFDETLEARIRLRPAGSFPPAYFERFGREWLANGLEVEHVPSGNRWHAPPRVGA